MTKIDRLGWAAAFTCTAFGLRIGVRVNDPQIVPHLQRLLPPASRLESLTVVDRLYSFRAGGRNRASQRQFHLLYADATQSARTLDLEEALRAFETDAHMFVAEFTPPYVFVHAGVVGWQGKAIVVPGASFSGKTTLVMEFIRAGATYFSDEFAVFDRHGNVHPFARPLGVREDSAAQTKYAVEELGGTAATSPLPLGLVLATKYTAGTGFHPREMSPAHAVLALLANTVSARRYPTRTMAVLSKATERAKAVTGTRGEASRIVDFVLGQIESCAESDARMCS